MADQLLTVEEAAKKLAVKKYTIYKLTKEGELPTVVVAHSFRYEPGDLESYIERQKDKVLVKAISEKNQEFGRLGQQERQRRREVEAA